MHAKFIVDNFINVSKSTNHYLIFLNLVKYLYRYLSMVAVFVANLLI